MSNLIHYRQVWNTQPSTGFHLFLLPFPISLSYFSALFLSFPLKYCEKIDKWVEFMKHMCNYVKNNIKRTLPQVTRLGTGRSSSKSLWCLAVKHHYNSLKQYPDQHPWWTKRTLEDRRYYGVQMHGVVWKREKPRMVFEEVKAVRSGLTWVA